MWEELPKRVKLLEQLKGYSFDGFLHTTEFENFINIIKSEKLCSRENVSGFIDRADPKVLEQTADSVKNCVRFYYAPKTPTNFRAKYQNPVLLVFNEDLIYEKGVKFTSGNAAAISKSIITENADDAKSFDWNEIFKRGSHYTSIFGNNGITNKRNAEFLYPISVSTKKLVKVIFKYLSDKIKAEEILSSYGLNALFEHDDKYFD
ncbi:MAG: DUF4433 domain-containing protein [Clostridiales bacterium]|nr:DUF4433 domain-containing protein [Clostridiales bacterium]